MHRTVLAALAAAISAFLFAGCATTSEDPRASAETWQPGAVTPGGQPQAAGGAPIGSAEGAAAEAGAPAAMRKQSTGKQPADMLAKRSIYYDLDQHDIKDEYRGIVEAHAKYLRENPASRVRIEGNADERGSREYNIGLGQRRSDGVKSMLLLLGARDDQIESVSLGAEKPVCADQGERCWWQNRRGDIRYTSQR
jgi:peptidoglycan-associated lipoprotein